MLSKFQIFKIGFFDVAPHLLSVIPFGIIFGAIGIELGFDPIMTYATSLIIFGGASQIVFLQFCMYSFCFLGSKYFAQRINWPIDEMAKKNFGQFLTTQAGWQELCGGKGGPCQKVWTRMEILSLNIRYFVAN